MIGAWVAAAVMASVHLLAGRLDLMRRVPRSRALSAAGGAGAAYALLHLLPQVAHLQQRLEDMWLPHAAWVALLVGVVVFYGLEALLCRHRDDRNAPPDVYGLHVAVFVLYNGTIGYLLFWQDDLVLFSLAVGLHMLVTDSLLTGAHPDLHRRFGRWVVAAAILVGAMIGQVTSEPALAADLLIAVLTGGILLNVLKEELPASRRSSFTAFIAGIVAMAALLLWR